MAQLTFDDGRLNFQTDENFFKVLGVIANNKYTNVYYENNQEQGAWAGEGRIAIFTESSILSEVLRSVFTKGVGGILWRVNCSEYVEYIKTNFGVQVSTSAGNKINQDYNAINLKIPLEFYDFFNKGYNS